MFTRRGRGWGFPGVGPRRSAFGGGGVDETISTGRGETLRTGVAFPGVPGNEKLRCATAVETCRRRAGDALWTLTVGLWLRLRTRLPETGEFVRDLGAGRGSAFEGGKPGCSVVVRKGGR